MMSLSERIKEATQHLNWFASLLEKMGEELDFVRSQIEELRRQLVETIRELGYSLYDIEEFKKFLKKPYLIEMVEKKEGVPEYKVYVPNWVPLRPGWLERKTESFSVYRVTHFMKWAGAIPPEIEKNLFFPQPPFKAKIISVPTAKGRAYYVMTDNMPLLRRKYGRYLGKLVKETVVAVRKGMEFELLVNLLNDGILPFNPQPVAKEDLRDLEPNFKLRDYQERIWRKFLETGWVGVFLPQGAGKSFIAMYIMCRLRGRKLILVPTRTLIEQWEEMILKHCPPIVSAETTIITYQSIHKVKDKSFTLVIYDECHHVPSDTYSRAYYINAKYRISLSGSPHREDGRDALIFALSGFPTGMVWQELFERGYLKKPVIEVYITRNKFARLQELMRKVRGKTIIFCDFLFSFEIINLLAGVSAYNAFQLPLSILF